ncbi:MAG TPA: GGDEF domain-containing protein [Quisquiliibacterium sp.]|nr:GGDEF domain-containing protein [Quisquiliibacterium sp.]
MPQLIESAAQMTSTRDRDVMEVTVAKGLLEVIQPERIRLFKLISAPDAVYVHRRLVAHADGGMELEHAPRASDGLKRLDAHPYVIESAVHDGALVKVPNPDGAPVFRYACAMSSGRPVGWVELDTRAPLSPEQVRMVQALLRVYANHLSILDYSEHDSLTGLMNRKTFDDTFLKVLAAFQRSPQSAGVPSGARVGDGADAVHWLAVVDIDHFKRINDRFGHLYGDEVLVLIARLMRDAFRLPDRLYRFGGEEFAILLDRTPDGHALQVFERFRARVEAERFPQVGQVTVSLGCTRIGVTDSPPSAFDRADEALYWAKQNGRNRVGCYEMLRGRGLLSERTVHGAVELF